MRLTNFISAKLILAKNIYNKISRTSSFLFFFTDTGYLTMPEDLIRSPIEIIEIVFCGTAYWECVKNVNPVFLHN